MITAYTRASIPYTLPDVPLSGPWPGRKRHYWHVTQSTYFGDWIWSVVYGNNSSVQSVNGGREENRRTAVLACRRVVREAREKR